jgi:hypothetical protein
MTRAPIQVLPASATALASRAVDERDVICLQVINQVFASILSDLARTK